MSKSAAASVTLEIEVYEVNQFRDTSIVGQQLRLTVTIDAALCSLRSGIEYIWG
jgi:hypothetical protein